jgi:adenylosuccinate synthase
MNNTIILGAQWGDEGKGKLVDVLAKRFDIVVRYQGGHNAGHTVFIGEKKFVLKLVPTGILRPGKMAVIGNGLVIDPEALLSEIDMLTSEGINVSGRLFVSGRAHVLLPIHRVMEKLSEASRPIGTTSRGIGPCYEDKTGRRGIRVAELLDRELFRAKFDALMEEKIAIAEALGSSEKMEPERIRQQYEEFADRIRPMVCDTIMLLNRAMREGKAVLFEGAQGTMLDLDHGTYPFVTSSSASAGGACTGAGVPPTSISRVVGVAKAYITRVGGGPFPTEALDGAGEQIRQRGNEFGSVTGRPRRCGWFDIPLTRYSAAINGIDTLVITKLDVLDEFDNVPVCVAYRYRGLEVQEIPPTVAGIEEVEPVYECLPGWKVSTFGMTSYDQLPARAKEYLAFLEDRAGVEIGCISTGPERTQTIIKPGSRFEELLG